MAMKGIEIYSPSARANEIGNKAEEIVFAFLSQMPGVSRLKWHSREGDTPGYDISYVRDGTCQVVEVKGTVSSAFLSFFFTINEYQAAIKQKENYYLFLVTDCYGAPKMEIIKNPAKLIEDGSLTLSPMVFKVECSLEGGLPL